MVVALVIAQKALLVVAVLSAAGCLSKADLTGEGARSLNQNAGDTVVQALGAAAMPAADAKTRAPSSKETAAVSSMKCMA